MFLHESIAAAHRHQPDTVLCLTHAHNECQRLIAHVGAIQYERFTRASCGDIAVERCLVVRSAITDRSPLMPSFAIPLSGLAASSEALNIISNNLANMNTIGFKDRVQTSRPCSTRALAATERAIPFKSALEHRLARWRRTSRTGPCRIPVCPQTLRSRGMAFSSPKERMVRFSTPALAIYRQLRGTINYSGRSAGTGLPRRERRSHSRRVFGPSDGGPGTGQPPLLLPHDPATNQPERSRNGGYNLFHNHGGL